ncbi:unnamed protein product [Rotaria magnacalcarata]|uniref:26S proteasome non-ATPase regulatory subunit 6 n=3 Tax=Rotaria magnacalcarata TaxID=392030 RepID=A0A816N691_9BILA|nr:unnamed protein product [Rotaria magnacalcarata]CAF2094638.1 unnamed protein product [Rotaria magnacalcarata]CAF2115798.1 unnamed protein product [Rotaria magnacalcarata]CAF3735081.1 unnamed protein product [Rotaria magnacalcarata]CAF3784138.1 unnamed protein product [Rotaria magnacalcarata]
MPIEDLSDEGLPKVPNLDLAQIKFLLTIKPNDVALKEKLLNEIKLNSMASFYSECVNDGQLSSDDKLLQTMRSVNEEKIKEFDEKIQETEKTFGDSEIRECYLAKVQYLCTIVDREQALTWLRKTYEKTVTLGHRLDLIFYQLRLGLFYMDQDLIGRNLDKAKTLVDEGGDWDRRNRMKVYQGLRAMSIRDFKSAAELFLDTVATFTSYELMDYQTFVTYTVICSLLALERPKLREKVIRGSEILEILHGLPLVKEYLFSLYECRYADFFRCLAKIEHDLLSKDRYFAPHAAYYVREMRIIAYNQLLQSYSSLTLKGMAQAFGSSEGFLDKELSRFIANGRLNCKIDKVRGIIETTRPDSKNFLYQEVIKKGDLLLNRVQKLSRVINI